MSKKKIGLVYTTISAIQPIMNYFTENAPEYQLINYVDGYLMEMIREDGGITDRSVSRMLDMIGKACADGADAILLTCTIFSPYQPMFSSIFSVPIICPDGAMQDQVSRLGGKTAIVCSFPGTIEPTKKLYLEYCRNNGMPETVDMYVVPEAYAASQLGDLEECNRHIREKVLALDESYDQIMLAQISISGAMKGTETKRAKIFSSPSSALEAVRSMVEKTEE